MKIVEKNYLNSIERGLVELALVLGYDLEEIRTSQKSDREGNPLTWSDNTYNAGLGRVGQPVLMLTDATSFLVETKLQLRAGMKLIQAHQAGELKFKKHSSTKKD